MMSRVRLEAWGHAARKELAGKPPAPKRVLRLSAAANLGKMPK